jgi:cytochrome c biogenesis protein CcmG, thiol:disulfide interchange protein DsbE
MHVRSSRLPCVNRGVATLCLDLAGQFYAFAGDHSPGTLFSAFNVKQDRLVMSKLSKYRVLIAGIVSPFAALILYELVYGALTHYSSDREKDWQFRLTASTIAMLLPFVFTVLLVWKDRRAHGFSLSGKIGLTLALLSLGLAWNPIHDGIARARQIRNQALRDVAAPAFDTLDIAGRSRRLADYYGDVVIVNVWATWCEPCRDEMPKLDQLYRDRKDKGLMVFGISDEDVPTQQKFVQQIPITYPLLTLSGKVPSLYRDIAQYPATFLVDRKGRLQPAPRPGQPFEKTLVVVNSLLSEGSH